MAMTSWGFPVRCPSFETCSSPAGFSGSLFPRLFVSSPVRCLHRFSSTPFRNTGNASVSPRSPLVGSWSSGFYPPHCYQRFIGPESLVLLVDLSPSAPVPLELLSLRFRFMPLLAIEVIAGGSPWVRLCDLPVSHPAAPLRV